MEAGGKEAARNIAGEGCGGGDPADMSEGWSGWEFIRAERLRWGLGSDLSIATEVIGPSRRSGVRVRPASRGQRLAAQVCVIAMGRVGVTTAATLWLATVIGLCKGGGQIALGLAATALGLFALWVLKWVESALRRETYARFSIEADATGPGEAELLRRIADAGLAIVRYEISVDRVREHRIFVF